MTVWVMLVGVSEWYLWRRRPGAGTSRYRRHVWRRSAEGQRALGRQSRQMGDPRRGGGRWHARKCKQSGAFGLVDSMEPSVTAGTWVLCLVAAVVEVSAYHGWPEGRRDSAVRGQVVVRGVAGTIWAEKGEKGGSRR